VTTYERRLFVSFFTKKNARRRVAKGFYVLKHK